MGVVINKYIDWKVLFTSELLGAIFDYAETNDKLLEVLDSIYMSTGSWKLRPDLCELYCSDECDLCVIIAFSSNTEELYVDIEGLDNKHDNLLISVL